MFFKLLEPVTRVVTHPITLGLATMAGLQLGGTPLIMALSFLFFQMGWYFSKWEYSCDRYKYDLRIKKTNHKNYWKRFTYFIFLIWIGWYAIGYSYSLMRHAVRGSNFLIFLFISLMILGWGINRGMEKGYKNGKRVMGWFGVCFGFSLMYFSFDRFWSKFLVL